MICRRLCIPSSWLFAVGFLASCGDGSLTSAPPPTSSSLSDASTSVLIQNCGTVIRAPGAYELVQDLLGCPGNGIEIAGNNISLRLSGHSIAGTGTWTGLSVQGSNILIQGPGSIHNFALGLSFLSVSGSSLTQVRSDNNQAGLITSDFTKPQAPNQFLNNVFVANLNGVVVSSFNQASPGTYGIFRDNIVNRNQYRGFQLTGHGAELRANTVSANGSFGIWSYLGYASVMIGNSAARNAIDMVDDNANCGGNTWRENKFASSNQSCIH